AQQAGWFWRYSVDAHYEVITTVVGDYITTFLYQGRVIGGEQAGGDTVDYVLAAKYSRGVINILEPGTDVGTYVQMLGSEDRIQKYANLTYDKTSVTYQMQALKVIPGVTTGLNIIDKKYPNAVISFLGDLGTLLPVYAAGKAFALGGGIVGAFNAAT